MPLTPRGNTPQPNGKPNNEKVEKNIRNAERAFGIEGQIDHTDPQAIKDSMSTDTQNALGMFMAAMQVYQKMQASPGDDSLLREFYMLVDAISEYPKDVLRTIIASGVVSTATLRETMKDED